MLQQEWLKTAVDTLEKSGVMTARLDALVLLEDVLSKDRSYLLAHPEIEISTKQITRLDAQVARRAKHEPLAYLRGKTEFYGREFIVSSDVLEPRPETETMIDIAKEIAANNPRCKTFIDVGTGSGAIGVTLALELREGTFMGIDVDKKCLAVARKNAVKHKATFDLLQANLLDHASVAALQSEFCVLANLPYVPNSHQLNEAAKNEPRAAIFGGEDGLDLYRTMFDQIDHLTNKPSHILTESLPFQHHALAQLARSYGYAQTMKQDFIQCFEHM